MGNLIGRSAQVTKQRMNDLRDWPPGGEIINGVSPTPRTGGLCFQKGSDAALTPFPRVPRNSGIPPKTAGEASPRQGHHSACLQGRQRNLCCWHWSTMMIRWKAICWAWSHYSWRTMTHWDPTHLEKSMEADRSGIMWNKGKGNLLGVWFPEPWNRQQRNSFCIRVISTNVFRAEASLMASWCPLPANIGDDCVGFSRGLFVWKALRGM